MLLRCHHQHETAHQKGTQDTASWACFWFTVSRTSIIVSSRWDSLIFWYISPKYLAYSLRSKWRVQITQTGFKSLESICFLMPGCILYCYCYRANWTLYIPDWGPKTAARFPVQMDYTGQECHEVHKADSLHKQQYLPASYLIVELVSTGKPAAFPAFQMEVRMYKKVDNERYLEIK